jgi:flagellar biogenesis protein FliO
MLAAAGFVDLVVRMLTSLTIVLAIVAVAYVVMRRRAGSTRRAVVPGRAPRGRSTSPAGRGAGALRSGRAPRAPRAPRRGHRSSVEVIGRVGLSRSTAAVAVRFGDRVLLIGASDQAQPSVLAEVDAVTWELCQARDELEQEWSVPAEIDVSGDDTEVARPGFLEALREATVRRA